MGAFSRLLAAWIAGCAAAGRLPPDPRIDELIVEPVPGQSQVSVRAILSGDGRAPFAGTLELTLGERSLRLPVALDAGPAGATGALTFNQLMPLSGAKSWTPARPVLYQMQAALLAHGRTIDRHAIRFGIRTVALADGRLSLNGSFVQVRGLEFRPDWSLTLSARAREAMAGRSLQHIVDRGFTMILAEPGLLDDAALDWCDRHGLLVTEGPGPAADPPRDAAATGPDDRGGREAFAMVRRHRNHPSVVLWRIAPDSGNGEAERLRAAVALLDPGRPVVDAAPWPELGPEPRPIRPQDVAALGLEREFPTATAFDEAAARAAAVDQRHRLDRLRLDPAAPGFILSRPAPELLEAAGRIRLVIRPAPLLLADGEPLCATLTVAGSGPELRDAVLDYRLQAPGDDPALPMPWRPGPPLRDGSAILSAAPLPVRGRWVLSAQLRRGRRVLATAEERVVVVAALVSSQQSFAMAGGDDAVQEAFGAWVIPAEFARQIVLIRPAAMSATGLQECLAAVRTGKKALLFELDDRDCRALAEVDPLLDGFALSATLAEDASLIHYVHAGTLGNGLPGLGRGQPEGWIAGELFAGLLPDRAFAGEVPRVLAGAVRPGSSADTGAARWTEILELSYGAGRIIICQYRLLGHLHEPMARAIFYRLLAL